MVLGGFVAVYICVICECMFCHSHAVVVFTVYTGDSSVLVALASEGQRYQLIWCFDGKRRGNKRCEWEGNDSTLDLWETFHCFVRYVRREVCY
jgi:hypothetical protein